MATRLGVILVVVVVAACNQKGEKKDDPATAPAAATPMDPASPAAPTPAAAADVGPPLDACSLLSAADVEAGTKQKSSEPKPVADTGPAVAGMKMASCIYEFADSPDHVTLVRVNTVTHASADAAAKMWEFTNKNNASLEQLPGIGDAAHWRAEGTAAEFRKGRYQVDIDVNDSDDRDAAIALAKKAVLKVP